MSNPLDENPTRVDQNQAEATQLYRLATEQGIAGTQYRLGVMYAEGQEMAQAGLGLAYGASARGEYLDENARPGNPTHETRAGEITP